MKSGAARDLGTVFNITDYLVNFYNPIPLHSTLGSPNDYKKAIA